MMEVYLFRVSYAASARQVEDTRFKEVEASTTVEASDSKRVKATDISIVATMLLMEE